MKLSNILDIVINRLPVIKFLDGYKTVIGGAAAGLSATATAIAPFLPPLQAGYALTIAAGAAKVAGYMGVWGIAGKTVKVTANEPAMEVRKETELENKAVAKSKK